MLSTRQIVTRTLQRKDDDPCDTTRVWPSKGVQPDAKR